MADTTVNLNLMAPGYWGPNVPNGWSPSTGTEGYVYQFTGGNTKSADGTPKDDGSWSFTQGSGTKTIEIKLVTADGGDQYFISSVDIHYDDETKAKDLTPPDLAGNPARSCIITDSDIDKESGSFKVTCNFNDVTGIVCDPRWDND